MKLRNIFAALTVAALAFVGCQQDEKFLDEVQVSQSMVAIDIDGGSAEITVTAAAKWEFAGVPEWLTVSPASGAAGETVVKFSAGESDENNEAVLSLNCDGVTQVVTVIQMAEKVPAPLTSCGQVLADNAAGTAVGKIYKVKGSITDLTNYDKYGCFYVNDGTGTVYVYGSMNYSAFKPEVGDIITFEGPWTSYGNFDDVTIVELEKSFIKLEKVISTPLPLDGGVATVLLTVKEGDFAVEIPEDAAWLTAGEPTTVGGMTCVELTAVANEGGARKTSVTFKTTVKGVDYIAMTEIEQLGAIAEVTVAEFLAKPVGTSLYKLTGKVSGLKAGDYGNFHLVDATGSVYVYGLTATPVSSNDKSFPTLGIKEGDVVTLIGTRAHYANAKVESEKEQVGGPAYYVSHISAKESTISDFLAASVSSSQWYKLTGTIDSIVKEDYGNFYLKDETGTVYVYGLTAAPVAKNDKSFSSLGLKVGDKITLVGTRSQYANASDPTQKEQVGGPAYFVTKVE